LSPTTPCISPGSASFWNDVHQSSQQALRAWVEGAAPWLWNSVVRVILDQPVFAVNGRIGNPADAPVPATQAIDRLFEELTGYGTGEFVFEVPAQRGCRNPREGLY